MTQALLLLAVFVTAYTGFALYALSQPQHWCNVVGQPVPDRGCVLILRGIGTVMLAVSLLLALLRDGPSFGSLLWATLLSLAALAVAFTLAWRPRWLRFVDKWLSVA